MRAMPIFITVVFFCDICGIESETARELAPVNHEVTILPPKGWTESRENTFFVFCPEHRGMMSAKKA